MAKRKNAAIISLTSMLLLANLNTVIIKAEGDEFQPSDETEEVTPEETEEAAAEETEEAAPEEAAAETDEPEKAEETAEETTEEPAAEPAEETTEEPEAEEPQVTVVTKEFDVDDAVITVEYESDAFEGDAEIEVRKVEEDSDEFEGVENSLKDFGEQNADYAFDKYAVYDIAFIVDGEKAEPDKAVKVSIELKEKCETKPEVFHINEEGYAEVIDAEVNDELTAINFENDEFSYYAIGWNDKGQLIDENSAVITSGLVENQQDGKKYYVDAQGNLVKGQQVEIDGKYYFFDANTGVMHINRWHKTGTSYVYYGADGARVTGYQTINGNRYYFNPKSGLMKKGWMKTENGLTYYYFNSKGCMVYGYQTINGKHYSFHEKLGKMRKGWKKTDDGKTYFYYNQKGVQLFGEQTINGKKYYFNEKTGRMFKGWKTVDGHKIYYGSNGAQAFAGKKINGYWYYFEPDTGYMIKGWFWNEKARKSVYYDSKGKMATGKVSINGIEHTFDEKTGKGTPEIEWVKKNVGGYRPWYIKVNTGTCVTTVYTRDYKGEFNIPVKAFICTTGKKAKPTPAGITFTSVKYRWYYNPIYDLWNQYCTFFGRGKEQVMFHSLAYESQNRYDMRVSQWGAIGKRKSSGCVRMYVRDCKWIYDNIPDGVTVNTFKGTKKDDRLGKPAKLGSLISGLRWDLTDVR